MDGPREWGLLASANTFADNGIHTSGVSAVKGVRIVPIGEVDPKLAGAST